MKTGGCARTDVNASSIRKGTGVPEGLRGK